MVASVLKDGRDWQTKEKTKETVRNGNGYCVYQKIDGRIVETYNAVPAYTRCTIINLIERSRTIGEENRRSNE